jgi:5-methylcytosine-specific restriction endonuclease McrA
MSFTFDAVTSDHKIALINSGENRESNLWPLCKSCHSVKTAFDVARKARDMKRAKKHFGIRRKVSRPLLGTVASGWKKHFDGTWERRT